MFNNEKEGMRCYSFTSYGGTDNLSTSITFDIHEDDPWYEIQQRFVNFLEANGFVFGTSHPIRELGDYVGD